MENFEWICNPFKNSNNKIEWKCNPRLKNLKSIELFSQTYANFSTLIKSYPNLATWYDATDPLNNGGTLPNNNDLISTWYDKSNNGYNLSNIGEKPTFKKSVINSLPSLEFINGNTVMKSAASFSNSRNKTIYIVCNIRTNRFGSRWSHSYNQAIRSGEMGMTQLDGTPSFGGGQNNKPFRMAINTDGNHNWPNSLIITPNSTVIYKITVVDGSITVHQKTDTAGTSSVTFIENSFDNQTGNIWVGGQSDMNAMDGYMCEIIYYQSALTQSQQQMIEGYLAWKWGLNTNLPPNHPYYSTEPSLSSVPVPSPSTLQITVGNNVKISGNNPIGILFPGSLGTVLKVDGDNVLVADSNNLGLMYWYKKSDLM